LTNSERYVDELAYKYYVRMKYILKNINPKMEGVIKKWTS